ncbi:MAG TPA: formate dehydrogenase accessory sulfurtransferase FdhD [Steroidobacteraceae bacterium]|nr:formate dehydrogenase accessory sulfurtransferase FdhD [Steroidobacteraceae bacterium]
MNAQREESPVREVSIDAMRDDRLTPRQDLVVVEEPLEIRIALAGETGPGTSLSITMRTPGHDIELALGFLHGEGIVRSREDVADSRICGPVGNVVRIQLAEGAAHDPDRLQRNFYTTSSCGVCGNASLAAVERMLRSPSVDDSLTVSTSLIESLSERARAGQDVFRETGGLHASCLFDASGKLLDVREDVGRHNALDKLVGARFLAGELPLSNSVLFLSGRASFELLQKAAAAGIPVVAAVGAPSSLAIDLAQRTGILLVGFLRGHSFNVYAHRQRLQ